MSIFIIVNVKIYLRDLKQTAKVGWEKIVGLLFMLSRITMPMLFLKWLIGHMESILWVHGCTIILKEIQSELIDFSDQLLPFD